MACEPCQNAARDLLRSLGLTPEIPNWRRTYTALHRRHEHGLKEGQQESARWVPRGNTGASR